MYCVLLLTVDQRCGAKLRRSCALLSELLRSGVFPRLRWSADALRKSLLPKPKIVF